MMEHLNMLGDYSAWQFWPVLVMLAGIGHFPFRKHVSGRILGLGLFLLGGALLAHSLEYVTIRWDLLWPLAVAAAGVYMIWTVAFVWRRPSLRDAPASDTVSNKVFLGEVNESCGSKVFSGGEASVFMGSYTLDLTKATIDGDEAHLFARSVMGEVKLRVPDSWRVSVKGLPVLGEVDDRTREAPQDGVTRPTLVVHAAVLLGSLQIMS